LNQFKYPEEMIKRLRKPEDMIGRAKKDIGSFRVAHPQDSLSHSSTHVRQPLLSKLLRQIGQLRKLAFG